MDFVIEVDMNNIADGGIWLCGTPDGLNGVLLVTGGNGWGFGDRGANAGRSLYWHQIVNGSFSAGLNPVSSLFDPGVSDRRVIIEVIGDTY